MRIWIESLVHVRVCKLSKKPTQTLGSASRFTVWVVWRRAIYLCIHVSLPTTNYQSRSAEPTAYQVIVLVTVCALITDNCTLITNKKYRVQIN